MPRTAPEAELLYDPDGLDPLAPRLYVRRSGAGWQLRDDAGGLLSSHSTQRGAIDAALARSRIQFSEILVRGSGGGPEWVVGQDELTRRLLHLVREQYAPRTGRSTA